MDNQKQYSNIYLLKERDKKHKQIMNTIYNYKRSAQQVKMLEKIKHATRMQIDFRYKNSIPNANYKFPFASNSFDQEFQQYQKQDFHYKNYILYDLHAQAQVVKKSLSTKTLSLDAGRRVKSLQKQHINDQLQIISKHKRENIQKRKLPSPTPNLNLNNNAISNHINQMTTRKNSLRDRSKLKNTLKFPELKVNEQKKANLQQIIGKKIYTQTSASPQSKRLGKYLKTIQVNSKQGINREQPKKFFLQEV